MMTPSHFVLLTAALGLAGCSSSSAGPGATAKSESEPEQPVAFEPAKVDVVRSGLERDTNPQLTDSERDIFAAGQMNFAVDFYHAVGKTLSADRNAFLSPHSVAIALGMTYAGARGETAAEIKKALRCELPDDRVHTAFNYLDLALAARGKGAAGKDGKPFRLNVANSTWGQSGMSFEAPFLDTLARDYGAGLNVVDFIAATEPARLAINGWVEDRTENRIKNLVPKGKLTSDTRLVLVNAVYFNAAWATSFPPEQTKPDTFVKTDGSLVDVQMMNLMSSRPYVKTDGYEAVEMAYDGDELSLLVIAPTTGTFAAFESSLTGRKVLDILASLKPTDLFLSFPKLKVEAEFNLNTPLQALGMVKAFGDADLSGMSRSEHLYISDVLHKTFGEIDENGTEAAAATAVINVASSTSAMPPSMRVDRPFLMAIVDRPTKTLLFLGRILEPQR